MKKLFSLLLATVICVLSLSSCSGISKIKVNGTKIDNEVYDYFEDLHDGNEGEIKKSISRYVTINTEFSKRNLRLSSAQKSDLSIRVDDLWHLYGIHYQDVGVSKQTLYKIETSKVYEDELLKYCYGQGGISPVSDETLKNYFKSNYIAIRFVTGYLFNVDEQGVPVEMTDSEKAEIINGFAKSVDLINTGSLIEEATSEEVHDALINSFYDGSFPTGFYSEVEGIGVGSAATVILDNYAFLVERVDVFDKTYNYYETHRTECLKKVKGDDFEKLIDKWSQNYVIE